MPEGSKQPNSVIPMVFISLLAAFGIIGVSIPRPPPAAQGEAATVAPAASQPTKAGNSISQHSGVAILSDFLADSALDQADDRPWLREDRQQARKFLAGENRARYHLKLLIGTLPVPISPALRSSFDYDLAAITAAASDDAYTVDGSDLPWTEAAKGKPEGSQSKTEPVARWVGQPGLILFRGNPNQQRAKDKRHELLLLFIVGETPTRGINKKAMRDALDQIAWLSQTQPGYEYLPPVVQGRRKINIVGPSFSGSAPSIRNELESWFGSSRGPCGSSPYPLDINIFSGAATALQLSDLEPKGCPNSSMTYTHLLVNDDDRWRLIVPALREGVFNVSHFDFNAEEPVPEIVWRHQENQIALLAEDTAYGRSPREGKNKDKIPDLIRLPYPLQISELRTAFAQSKQVSTVIGPNLGPPDVPESDEGDQPSLDVIPPFSTRTPAYEQLDLAGLLTTIQREHVRDVGIMSSDVADLIFLAGEVRQYSPDRDLFTLSSDLRVLRADVNPDLYGMLVFSTYPLRTEDQLWNSRPGKTDLSRQFPDETAEGAFNATLMALGDPGDMLDQGAPFVKKGIINPVGDSDAESAPVITDDSELQPVLWAGVVGHDQIWPLYFQWPSDPSKAPTLDDLKKGCMDYPLPFVFAFIALMSLCLLTAILALLRPLYVGGFAPARRWLAARVPAWMARLTDPIGGRAFENAERKRRQYVSGLSVGLFIAFAIGAAYFWLPAIRIGCGIGNYREFWLKAAWFGLPALAFVTVVSLIVAIATNLARARPLAPSLWLVLLLIVPAAWFVVQLWSVFGGFVPLVFMRSVFLNNGVSPLKPLIYLGIAALALSLSHLRQVNYLEDYCLPGKGFLGFKGASFEGLEGYEDKVARRLRADPLELPGAYFLLALVGVAMLYYLSKTYWFKYALDGQAFGLFYTLSAGLIYAGLFMLLLRFVAIWAVLQKLLRRLYYHPTRGCYATLREKRLPGLNDSIRLWEPLHSMTTVEGCLERARSMLEIDPAFCASLKTPVLECEQELFEFNRFETDWKQAALKDLSVQGKMKELSEQVIELLDSQWRTPASDQHRSEKESELIEEAELFVAARVLDFLRRVFPPLVDLAGFAVAGIFALMLASSSYPLPAPNTGLWLAWIALLGAIGASMYVFVGLNMSGVISLLQGTTPGYFNLTGTFALQFTFFGLLPILAMLGAQFPHYLSSIVGWAGGLFGVPH
jgi:hypothetical protein